MTTYRRSGVDLDAAAEATRLISDLADATRGDEVVEGVGGFAGLYRLGDGRLLAASTDGVGTKIEIAREAGRLDTLGIDLVAMCANDVVCTGARPLFFLDYIAIERLVPEQVAELVAGVAQGCRLAECALLGGETAEHPGVLPEGRFDLAGFCVGLVEEAAVLGPSRVRPLDAIVALGSSGLHSNGFSLVRRLLADAGVDVESTPEGLDGPLIDELLRPTQVYVPAVLALAQTGALRAAAHVTGGGILENVPRALPEGYAAAVDVASWVPAPIFELIQRLGDVPREEMFRTFNMGIGMALIVDPVRVGEAVALATDYGFEAWVAGRVEEGEGVKLR